VLSGAFLLGEPMKRAYSVIDFRTVDEEQRIIEGIASTPAVDSYQSILESDGAEYKLPLPFLYQHQSRQPIGKVVDTKVSADGIRVRVQIAKAGIATFIDEAWALIKNGLVRGLSVGFDPIEETYDKSIGGFRYIRWRWLELSAVTIAANSDASMTSVRSADEAILAALGKRESRSVVRLHSNNSAGVSAKPQGNAMKKTIAEQILDFQNKRAANQAAMDEIMDKAAEETRSLSSDESERYETLKAETADVDAHIERLKDHEKSVVARATKVEVVGKDPEKEGERIRKSEPIQVRKNEPKGIGMARMAICMIRGGNNPFQAEQLAKQYWPDSPEVHQYIRTIIEAGDTTTSGWASQLLPAAQQMTGDFLEMLRDLILIGRIPNLRSVPFNVAVPLQSGGGTYGYVGEGAAKPVTKPTYGSATLRFEKAAGIIVITQELARFSNPSAELLVRNEMLAGLTRFFDTIFVSTTAAVTNVQPAGILNGISSTAVTGTTAAKFRVDFNTIMQKQITNKRDPAKLVILMSSGLAMSLASMINSLGNQEFPTINARGGEYMGIPIVTSGAVGTNIILIDPTDILLAEDPAVRIDVSTEASVEMSDAPAVGESSPITSLDSLKSLWQNNLVGIRAEQFRTWKVARSSAVEYLTSAAYLPS
jgi:HK97 family phage major capsid protein/HK97 family phage prohead protease